MHLIIPNSEALPTNWQVNKKIAKPKGVVHHIKGLYKNELLKNRQVFSYHRKLKTTDFLKTNAFLIISNCNQTLFYTITRIFNLNDFSKVVWYTRLEESIDNCHTNP